jgi:hypothetical protein
MENMYQGLPRRTVFGLINGEPREFNISTDVVGDIISPILDNKVDAVNDAVYDAVTSFDNSIMYYVPIAVFSFDDDKAIVFYINKFIDECVSNK